MKAAGSLLAISLLASSLGGCAHAEFDLLTPQDQARRIGTKDWASISEDPLEYRMIAYDDHLILRIYNRSDTGVRLLADQSAAVDPGGQSHPLPIPPQTILAGSYVKLILPPNRASVVPTGPSIHFGFGAVYGSAWHHRRSGYYGGLGYGYPYDAYWYGVPRYYSIYGADESAYWIWPENGVARLVLVFAREAGLPGIVPTTNPASVPPVQPGIRFTKEFSFRRVSAK